MTKMNFRLKDTIIMISTAYKIFMAFCICFNILIIGSVVQAQTVFNGRTPLGLASGSPAGSYALTDFEDINLYNGHLNVNMPLLQIGGRGNVGYTMFTVVNNTRWVIEPRDFGFGSVQNIPQQGGSPISPGYGPGIMQGRGAADPCAEGTSLTPPLTRLTFTQSDGTEIEFVDQIYNGVAQWKSCYNSSVPQVNRGKIFNSIDGSFATFISDTDIMDYYTPLTNFFPSGYLLSKNGTRYRIVNGGVEWMQDKNGNRITFAGDTISTPDDGLKNRLIITDSLNRQITVTYDLLHSGNTRYDKIEWKGTNGATREIRVFRTAMSSALASGNTIKHLAELFPETTGGPTYGEFNPFITSSIQLPDGRSYQFLYNSYGEIARVVLPTGGAIEYDYTIGTVEAHSSNGLFDIGYTGVPGTPGYMAQASLAAFG